MTGFLPEDLPDPSDDEAGSLIGSAAGGIPGQVLHTVVSSAGGIR